MRGLKPNMIVKSVSTGRVVLVLSHKPGYWLCDDGTNHSPSDLVPATAQEQADHAARVAKDVALINEGIKWGLYDE